jgi:glycosyltransferase involved in cell wall biosynthesis
MTELSVVLATLNEAANLEACLRSVAWADEIIVVDDGSTDGTVEIARRFTNKVVVSPSHGNFHANKNLALQMATKEWVLSLDADEVIPDALAEEIRLVILDTPHAAFRIGRRNYFLGRWIRYGGWYPDRIIRLFRKGVTQWPLAIHETPHIATPALVGELTAEFLHYSYRSLDQYFEKFNRYTSRLALEADQRGEPVGPVRALLQLFLRPPAWFLYRYVARMGILDGLPGLFIAFSSALVIAVSYFKLWEIRTRPSPRVTGS